jgi:hypothetical protein
MVVRAGYSLASIIWISMTGKSRDDCTAMNQIKHLGVWQEDLDETHEHEALGNTQHGAAKVVTSLLGLEGSVGGWCLRRLRS